MPKPSNPKAKRGQAHKSRNMQANLKKKLTKKYGASGSVKRKVYSTKKAVKSGARKAVSNVKRNRKAYGAGAVGAGAVGAGAYAASRRRKKRKR